MTIIKFSEIIEKNGKTIFENNVERHHKLPLGTIVQVEGKIFSSSLSKEDDVVVDLKGTCHLYVVAHTRDCDGTPLYHLSDIPVEYQTEGSSFSIEKQRYKLFSKLLLRFYSEEDLKSTGRFRKLAPDVNNWMNHVVAHCSACGLSLTRAEADYHKSDCGAFHAQSREKDAEEEIEEEVVDE